MNQNLGGIERERPLPAELEGFNLAAFFWGGIWAVANRVWIGLLAFVPLFGLAMNVVLGVRGTRWAWEKGAIPDIERYKKGQRNWLIAFGVLVVLGVPLTGVFSALAIYGVKKYVTDAKRLEAPRVLVGMVNGMKQCAERGELPPSSNWVPATLGAVSGMKYQSASTDWSSQPAFACSGFAIPNPQYFRYRWVQATEASGQFEAEADLNGDGVVDQAFTLGMHCTPSEGCVTEPMLGGGP